MGNILAGQEANNPSPCRASTKLELFRKSSYRGDHGVKFKSARTIVGNWQDRPANSGHVQIPLPDESRGAPLIDRSGSLLGLVVDPQTVVQFQRTDDLRAQALASLAEPSQRDLEERTREASSPELTPGRGFPWKWVGAGSGTAGGCTRSSTLHRRALRA